MRGLHEPRHARRGARVTRPTSSFRPASDLAREDVEQALQLASHKTAKELRDELGAFQAVKYQICFGSEVYDAKAIIQLAWNLRNPGRELAASDFRGSREHVAKPLRALGFEVLEIETHRTFGSIPGVRIGETFDGRKALSRRGIHRPLQAGISGSAADGADSIVVSGGYVDDQDFGDRIIYTGHGGNDPTTKRQIGDQELTRGNMALAVSCDRGLPVRVTRGKHDDSEFAPSAGYRYDGLFQVTNYWPETGLDGYRIWRFALVQIDQSPPIAPEPPSGTQQPARRATHGARVSRNLLLAEWVKQVHDWTCQFCGARLTTIAGPYAEAAHITPLGAPHNGPDTSENLLCLCPNCHVRFDRLALHVGPDGAVTDTVMGSTCGHLRHNKPHRIGEHHLSAHRERCLLSQTSRVTASTARTGEAASTDRSKALE